MSDFLKALRTDTQFRKLMENMTSQRPVVPDFVPMETMEETAALVEKIKFSTGQRAGFDRLYQLLMGIKP